MNDEPKLYLGFYRVQDWMCPRYFYHQHIEKIEKNELNLPFLIGRIVPHGIREIYKGAKIETIIKTIKGRFDVEYNWAKKTFKSLDEETEQSLNEIKFIAMGMMEGYRRVYAKRIESYKLPEGGNEVGVEYELRKNVIVKMAIDNLFIEIKNKKKVGEVLHELKTTARLTPAYVTRIQTDLQTAMYWYLPRKVKGFKYKPTKILYDVIRKPQIRQTQNESYKEFLIRLSEYYIKGDIQKIFYSEPIDEPLISEHNMMNTLHHVADEMEDAIENANCYTDRQKKLDQFRQNFDACFRQDFKCQYYDLCHRVKNETELKSVMAEFKKKEPFRK